MPRSTLPLLLIFAALFITFSGCTQTSDDRDWLVGRWELAYNPEHDDEDVLLFKTDGSVEIHTVDGRKVLGKYLLTKNKLAITLISRRQPIDVSFSINPDRTRLRFKNGAYYERKK